MKRNKHIVFMSVSLSLLALVAVGLWQRLVIYDWVRLRNYVPSSEIAKLATSTTMNDNGRKLFYVHWPTLQDKTAFNESCTDSEESIVLGCYIRREGIYLFDVQDERLAGVEEVTAAHEMLHAAYDRLSESEREKIDQLTEDAFLKLKNERIIKTVEAYRKKDPSTVSNELHSIIATEVRNIPAELEAYYKKYFDNRLKVVELSEKYEKSFTQLEQQAAGYKQQLDSLKAQIDTKNKQLEQEALNLSTEYKDLESRRATADAASFNIQVENYNARVAAYNNEVATVSGLIDQYNQVVKDYNQVVLEETELIKAIDSRPQTIQTQ